MAQILIKYQYKSFARLFKVGRFPKGSALWSPSADGEIPLKPSKTESGVRNATAFRGAANKTAAPFFVSKNNFPQKRFGETFLT